MEITTKRCLVLAGILLAFGVAARFEPKKVAPWRTEAWMESVLPSIIEGYSMIHSAVKPNQSYDAGKRQYDYLLPYGIVCRIFTKADTAIDTVAIAGNDRNTFHDPYFCLPGQGWKITESHQGAIPTGHRGSVPASVIRLKDPGGDTHIAVFCYKGPKGMHPTQNSLYTDWFLTELKFDKPPEGAFYRFMVVKGVVPEEDLLRFAASYLDAAYVGSQGVL